MAKKEESKQESKPVDLPLVDVDPKLVEVLQDNSSPKADEEFTFENPATNVKSHLSLSVPQSVPNPLSDEDENAKKINSLIKLFSDTANDIIHNYHNDRTQVNDALGYFENEVRVARSNGAKITPAMIEGWVKLLSVKSDINSNSISILDSMAKLLSAAKNNNLIVNVSNSSTGIDLQALLAQPKRSDEA